MGWIDDVMLTPEYILITNEVELVKWVQNHSSFGAKKKPHTHIFQIENIPKVTMKRN